MDMYQQAVTNLSESEAHTFLSLLMEYRDIFARSEFDLGNFTDIEHPISTEAAKPIKMKMRRTPASFVPEEESHLQKMLKAGVNRPSLSEWCSAPVLIRKRDGSVRWCVDYRALNNVTIKDVFPLPNVEECLDTLQGNIWFSKLDANSAYWQVRVSKEDQKKTAFITKYGLYEFVRMAFRLCNAPATFARVMNLILHGLNWYIVLAFLDDILVLGRNFDHHLENLEKVFQRLRRFKLKLKPQKCEFFQQKVEFLGRLVSKNGLEIGNEHIRVVQDWPVPRNKKDVQRFLGLANYHRSFIKDYAKMSKPLYNLTGKVPFEWGDEHKDSFDKIKLALTSPPVLTLPNNKDQFILDCDASDLAIGCELLQVQDGQEKVISYGSFALSEEQTRYCTTRKELLAVIRFTRQFRHYLIGRPVLVRTDHSCLTWLHKFKEPQGQLARWIEELSQYDVKIQHRKGIRHTNADALSRIQDPDDPCPNYKLGQPLESLPCGGCPKCARSHQTWSKFSRDVDDTVRLTSGMFTSRNVNCCILEETDQIEAIESPEVILEDSRLFTVCQTYPIMDPEQLLHSHMDIHLDEYPKACVVNAHSGEPRKSQSRNCSLYGQTNEEMSKGQASDPKLMAVVHWLRHQESPTQAQLSLFDPISKRYWINRERFVLDDDGILWIKNKKEEHRLVVPDAIQLPILELHHDIPSSGHQGSERTLERIKLRIIGPVWDKMYGNMSLPVTCVKCTKSQIGMLNSP